MITMTIEEVLKDAIDQINHLQSTITELTEEGPLVSTVSTIRTLQDAIKSPASQSVVMINEANVVR